MGQKLRFGARRLKIAISIMFRIWLVSQPPTHLAKLGEVALWVTSTSLESLLRQYLQGRLLRLCDTVQAINIWAERFSAAVHLKHLKAHIYQHRCSTSITTWLAQQSSTSLIKGMTQRCRMMMEAATLPQNLTRVTPVRASSWDG